MSWSLPVALQLDDEKESTERLFVVFSNHLSLGQWELARVCLRKLVQEKPDAVAAILRSLIYSNDADASSLSHSIPSSQHLAWLAYAEYVALGLSKGNQDTLHPYTRSWLEFRLLLHFVSSPLSASTLQELCDYHLYVHNWAKEGQSGDPSTAAPAIPILSNSCLDLLKDVLLEDPSLGGELISELSCHHNSDCFATDQSLQRLYVDSIGEELLTASLAGSSVNSPISNRTTKIYKMLALMDPTPDMVELDLDELFSDLLAAASDCDKKVVEKSRLYACLLGRETPFLIARFCQVEDHLWRNRDKSLARDEFDAESGADAWREMYLQATHEGYHVLEHLLVVGLDLVREGKFNELALLFARDEFGPLKPLMLLLGWPQCQSVETASCLLDALWSRHDAVGNPLIHDACRKLAYQTQLVQWCLEKARPLLTEPTSPGGQTIFCQMFEGLESHSVLYVLHRCTSLAHLCPEDVIELLRKSPLTTPLPSPAFPLVSPSSTPPTPDFHSLSQTPRRLSRQASSSAGPTHAEQERDISIFRSFCAVRNVVEAFLYTTGKQKKKDDRKAEQQQDDEVFYEREVTAKLKKARDALSHTIPLAYRVEVLEDLFSLLFIKTADVEDPTAPRDSDEDRLTPERNVPTCNVWSRRPDGSELSTSEERQGKVAGDSSTASGGLSFAFYVREDFVVDESVARDVLAMLKDSLLDLESAKFARQRSKTHRRDHSGSLGIDDFSRERGLSPESEEALVKTSVSLLDLQQRLARLNKHVNEAKWRFQLVSSTGTKKLKLEGSGVSVEETDSEIDVDDSSQAEEERAPPPPQETDNSVEMDEHSSSRPRKRRSGGSRRESAAPTNPSESSAEASSQSVVFTTTDGEKRLDSGGEGDTEEKKSTSSLQRRKRRGRRSGSPRRNRISGGRRLLSRKPSGIISRMLSSPDTLLQLCLRNGNYLRAQEVIRMFGMEGQQAANAVLFAEQLDQLSEQLKGPLSRLSPRSSPVPMRKKISAGKVDRTPSPSQMGSSATLETMKELLSSSVTPKQFPFLHNPPESIVSLSASLPSLVVFDLACSTTIVSVCRQFLTMAVDRIRGGGSEATPGPISFLRRAYDLFFYVQDVALPRLLTQGRRCLHVKSWEQDRELALQQEASYVRLKSEVKAATESTGTEVRKADVGYKSDLRLAMESLLQTYTSQRSSSADYIGRFFTHVDNFSSLLISCEEGTGGLDLTKRASNPLAVLNEGPTPTLGKLMFVKQISPYQLEEIARDLNLNLVKIIVHVLKSLQRA
eukprot:m.293509 g.293509  ORF g.293509 m.293509 type:complete len:1273 (+) comp40739_c0_seq9:44-3862(+)